MTALDDEQVPLASWSQVAPEQEHADLVDDVDPGSPSKQLRRPPSGAGVGRRVLLATAVLVAAGIGLAALVRPRGRVTSQDADPAMAKVKPTQVLGLREEFSNEDDLDMESDDVICQTQECDCSWATGGPLGFCSTIGCPCQNQKCWDCCCKTLFPEEYAYAMGMVYFPPLPWWGFILWCLLVLLLILLICGSCFVLAIFCLGMQDKIPEVETKKGGLFGKWDDKPSRSCFGFGPEKDQNKTWFGGMVGGESESKGWFGTQ